MTLGNDAPLLTRRQARELAQSQAAEAAETAARVEEHPAAKNVPERKKPTDRKPSEKGAAAKAAAAAEKAAADKVQAEADAAQIDADLVAVEQAEADRVRAAQTAGSTENSTLTGGESVLGTDAIDDRTLTRRELRAVVAARRAAADADADSGLPPNVEAEAAPSATAHVTPVVENVPLAPVPAPLVRPLPTPPVTTAGDGRVTTPVLGSRLPGLHPPLGHWSVDVDDVATGRPVSLEPFDDLMARGYGAGGIPTTTNALILPSIPNQGASSGPLADSGEILITGSFDLPRSLGSTGQIPSHFDSSELDHMLDKFDDDGAPNAAEPVKASRAVSTHGSSLNVMEPPKRHLASVPIVLAVTTAALALGVVALFVGGYLLNIF